VIAMAKTPSEKASSRFFVSIPQSAAFATSCARIADRRPQVAAFSRVTERSFRAMDRGVVYRGVTCSALPFGSKQNVECFLRASRTRTMTGLERR
jgi:hypothetical protein